MGFKPHISFATKFLDILNSIKFRIQYTDVVIEQQSSKYCNKTPLQKVK